LTMPAEQVDAMTSGTPAAAPPARGSALVTLLRELDRRPGVTYLNLTKGDTNVLWRRG
jgi:hypothetical protein